MKIIFCQLLCVSVLFCNYMFGQPGQVQKNNLDEKKHFKEIYVVKNGWHTGLVLKNDSALPEAIKAATLFKKYGYLDFGWGEAVFYQYPGFDLYLALKAILKPNASVVRVEGFPDTLANVLDWRDFIIRLQLDSSQYHRLCKYINESFIKNIIGGVEVSTGNSDYDVMFFRSPQKYHLFMTCNTWVARALEQAGLNLSTFLVITAYDLYLKLSGLKEAQIIKPYAR